MGLVRLIVIILLAALLYRWFRLWQAKRPQRKRPSRDQGQMVACKQCGVYLPEQEAVRDGELYYCSEAHRRADQAR